MKSHTTIGGKLLDGDDSALIRMARDIALSHHERWDGKGYPAGLAGEAIPPAGRIAALADVFDALSSKRLYKKVWTVEAAVEFIRKNSGRRFDPVLTALFIRELPGILAIRKRFCGTERTP